MAKGADPHQPRWTAGNAWTLEFDGAPVLALEIGSQVNAVNLPKLLEVLNAAGVICRWLKAPSTVGGSQVAAMKLPSQEEMERMCLGKKRMSEHAAGKVAEKYGQRMYFCPICKGWHCTHLLPNWEPRK